MRRCEVCANAVADGLRPGRPKLRRILIETRMMSLCERHARVLDDSGAQTLEDVRGLFPEILGRRSLVSRRAPLDRRVFPPRPEGRRRSVGRRVTDVD